MVRKIFYTKELNEAFLDKGYVVIPFFDPTQVADALHIFERQVLKSDADFYLSIWNNDVPSRRAVHELMEPMVRQYGCKLLVDYKPLISCFAVKKNTDSSAWSLHQDDSFTDETRFESLSIWVALTDVDDTNGAMRVLEGSHRVYAGPRSPTIPKLFSQTDEGLLKQMKTVNMKAGEAIIFNHRLLHDSSKNTSNQVRIASVSVMIPKEAPVWFYYNKGGLVDVIRLDDTYYLNFKLGDRPEGMIDHTKTMEEIVRSQTIQK